MHKNWVTWGYPLWRSSSPVNVRYFIFLGKREGYVKGRHFCHISLICSGNLYMQSQWHAAYFSQAIRPDCVLVTDFYHWILLGFKLVSVSSALVSGAGASFESLDLSPSLFFTYLPREKIGTILDHCSNLTLHLWADLFRQPSAFS